MTDPDHLENLFEDALDDLVPPARVTLPRILGVAALYGADPAARPLEVLDLGDKSGALLERFAASANVRHADFRTLTPGELGRFDVITVTGTLYSVPPDARAHLYAVIGGSLKPDGVALLTYFVGGDYHLRKPMYAMLTAASDPTASISTRAATARAHLAQLRTRVGPEHPHRPALEKALRYLHDQPDAIVVNEALNEWFDVFTTTRVQAALTPHELQFLGYLNPVAAGLHADLLDRTIATDAADFAGGSYALAVFGRPRAGAPDVRVPNVIWATDLYRETIGVELGDEVEYRTPGGLVVRSTNPALQAVIQRMIAFPSTFADLLGAASAAKPGTTEEDVAVGLAALWDRDYVQPTVDLSTSS